MAWIIIYHKCWPIIVWLLIKWSMFEFLEVIRLARVEKMNLGLKPDFDSHPFVSYEPNEIWYRLYHMSNKIWELLIDILWPLFNETSTINHNLVCLASENVDWEQKKKKKQPSTHFVTQIFVSNLIYALISFDDYFLRLWNF